MGQPGRGGRCVLQCQDDVDDNFLLAFTDGTWTTTPINGDCGYWLQDAVTLEMMTQEEADAETAEMEEE